LTVDQLGEVGIHHRTVYLGNSDPYVE